MNPSTHCGASKSHVSREKLIDVLSVQEAKSKRKEYPFPGFSSRQFCRGAFAHLHTDPRPLVQKSKNPPIRFS